MDIRIVLLALVDTVFGPGYNGSKVNDSVTSSKRFDTGRWIRHVDLEVLCNAAASLAVGGVWRRLAVNSPHYVTLREGKINHSLTYSAVCAGHCNQHVGSGGSGRGKRGWWWWW